MKELIFFSSVQKELAANAGPSGQMEEIGSATAQTAHQTPPQELDARWHVASAEEEEKE